MTQATRDVADSSDTTSFTEDQRLIWFAQKEMYLGFLEGNRERIDGHIDNDATIWDAVTETIARGMKDLNAIRATRPSGGAKPVVTAFAVEDPIIDVSGDLAVSRHLLRVERVGPDGTVRELMRVSAGWRRIGGSWKIIHAHEDLFSSELSR
jgi:ketosteroid isomerase-like protein